MHNQHPHAPRVGDLRQTSKGMRPGRDSGESGDWPTHSEPPRHHNGRGPGTLQSRINDRSDFHYCSWATAFETRSQNRADLQNVVLYLSGVVSGITTPYMD